MQWTLALMVTCVVWMGVAVQFVRAAEPRPREHEALESIRLELVYRDAQAAFGRGEYRTALVLLERYVELSEDEEETAPLLGVLDQIAQILLREA